MGLAVLPPIAGIVPRPGPHLKFPIPIAIGMLDPPTPVCLGMPALAAGWIRAGQLMLPGSGIRRIPTMAKGTTFLWIRHSRKTSCLKVNRGTSLRWGFLYRRVAHKIHSFHKRKRTKKKIYGGGGSLPWGTAHRPKLRSFPPLVTTINKDEKNIDMNAKKNALGELLLAIRSDMISRKVIKKSNLKIEGFDLIEFTREDGPRQIGSA